MKSERHDNNNNSKMSEEQVKNKNRYKMRRPYILAENLQQQRASKRRELSSSCF
jgi:hypothetical protein